MLVVPDTPTPVLNPPVWLPRTGSMAQECRLIIPKPTRIFVAPEAHIQRPAASHARRLPFRAKVNHLIRVPTVPALRPTYAKPRSTTVWSCVKIAAKAHLQDPATRL